MTSAWTGERKERSLSFEGDIITAGGNKSRSRKRKNGLIFKLVGGNCTICFIPGEGGKGEKYNCSYSQKPRKEKKNPPVIHRELRKTARRGDSFLLTPNAKAEEGERGGGNVPTPIKPSMGEDQSWGFRIKNRRSETSFDPRPRKGMT